MGKPRHTDTRQLLDLLTEPRSCPDRLALGPPPSATELGSEQTCSGHPAWRPCPGTTRHAEITLGQLVSEGLQGLGHWVCKQKAPRL